MNLFELLFVFASIICAFCGAIFLGQFGIVAGIAGGVSGLALPYALGQIACLIDDFRFTLTKAGQRRSIAESEFDQKHPRERLSSRRARPEIGKDGSLIVTVYYGKTRPPLRTFFRFVDDSMVPEEITASEAREYIKVSPML